MLNERYWTMQRDAFHRMTIPGYRTFYGQAIVNESILLKGYIRINNKDQGTLDASSKSPVREDSSKSMIGTTKPALYHKSLF